MFELIFTIKNYFFLFYLASFLLLNYSLKEEYLRILGIIYYTFLFVSFFFCYLFFDNFIISSLLFCKSVIFCETGSLHIDNITIWFVLLISLLATISQLVSWKNIYYNYRFFNFLLFSINFLLVLTFLSDNVFYFYFFFESTLILMFILIGVWGSRQRKMHAVYMYFFFTVFGSLFFLAALVIIYVLAGTFSSEVIYNLTFTSYQQLVLCLCFLVGFGVKLPVVPFHLWLPEAHVEAPTAGSIILAGILLKVGTYGLFKFVIPLFPLASKYYMPIVYLLALISIIYISCIAIRQVDLKKIIAYSSIAHMGFILLGLFTYNLYSISGSFFLMFSHGIISPALFICVGFLYDRYGTRLINYYSNLTTYMPLLSFYLFIFLFSNISFPGTSGFVGEFLVLVGIIEESFWVLFLAVFSVILIAVYSVWLLNRVLFGLQSGNIKIYADVNYRELLILNSLFFFIIILGVCPDLILAKIEFWIYLIFF